MGVTRPLSIKCSEINVWCQAGACLHWFLLLIPDTLDITHTDAAEHSPGLLLVNDQLILASDWLIKTIHYEVKSVTDANDLCQQHDFTSDQLSSLNLDFHCHPESQSSVKYIYYKKLKWSDHQNREEHWSKIDTSWEIQKIELYTFIYISIYINVIYHIEIVDEMHRWRPSPGIYLFVRVTDEDKWLGV